MEAVSGSGVTTDSPMPLSPSASPPLQPAHRSPEVLPDGRVRFRLLAPHAAKVTLQGDFQLHMRGPWPKQHPGAIALNRGEDGLWFHETARLEPGFYGYQFRVDGVPLLDPQNPAGCIFPTTTAWSYVDVPAGPGDPPALHEHRDGIPHGTVHHEVFFSRVLDRDVGCLVYTPPAFVFGPTRDVQDYPVLYLLHGRGHDERSWCSSGRAAQVVDNLISTGTIPQIVVVMPHGQLVPLTLPAGSPFDPREGEYFLEEVAHLAATHYGVRRDAAGSAVAGLSMGGSQSLRLMALHPGHFAAVGAFACALNEGNGIALWTEDRVSSALQHVRLLYIGYGHLEGPGFRTSFPPTLAVVQAAARSAPSLTLQLEEHRGAHQWPVWTRCLAQFVQAWQPA
jgi:enterochelin esterase family protein